MTGQRPSRLTWNKYAMRLASTASERSEDPYHKVGCCLLRADHTVAAMGFNGAPPGVDLPDETWADRDKRRIWILHAEANALRYVRPGEVTHMASTMMPCTQCVLLAASYGIKEITYRDELDATVYNAQASIDIAEACGISIYQETNLIYQETTA